MTRLCIFGTSHIAAPRLAYQSEPGRWPDLDVTFVGATGQHLLAHRIVDGVMHPATSKLAGYFQMTAGADTLDLHSFDAFALIGCHIGPHMIGHIYGQARWCALRSVKRKKPGPDAGYALISEAMLDALLQYRVANAVGGELARALRAVSDKPIMLSSAPRPSSELMEMRRHKLIAQKWAIRKADAQHLSRRFETLTRSYFAEHDVAYLPQPSQTIERHLLTREAYVLGAIRLTADGKTPQPDGDIMHGNRLYGEAVLDQISAALAHVEE
ncbi:hypothetical protein [Yoonia sp. SS1-5]|uniref:Uncharacterized protein n=1 Tax=Yoonia rhodophyticola TaxID=3137370 RepID=A0AAN0NKN3_9RHOB